MKLNLKEMMNKGYKVVVKKVKQYDKLTKQVVTVIIILVITVGGIYKFCMNQNGKLEDKRNGIVVERFEKEDIEKDVAFEYVQELRSGLEACNKLVYAEEQLRILEKYGYDSDNYVTLEGVFDVDYIANLENIKVEYDETNKVINVNIPEKDLLGVTTHLITDIKEVDKKETFGNKLKDTLLPWTNKDEQMKQDAMNRVMTVAKEKAVKPLSDLEDDFKVALQKTIDDLNHTKNKTTILINIVKDKQVVGIKAPSTHKVY